MVGLNQWGQESPRGWLKQTAGPTQSGGLGCDPRISTSNKFPGDADAAGLGPL